MYTDPSCLQQTLLNFYSTLLHKSFFMLTAQLTSRPYSFDFDVTRAMFVVLASGKGLCAKELSVPCISPHPSSASLGLCLPVCMVVRCMTLAHSELSLPRFSLRDGSGHASLLAPMVYSRVKFNYSSSITNDRFVLTRQVFVTVSNVMSSNV